ncbi:polycystic kidney disease protein 1-like 3 [Takifugu flavidus]|uniref:polycystic kidney disease protein 1-like 3 n=1 Tax=Takifugu flavidus TaxID=433684 RepID=UPI00254483A4|nr:polycystic kidney disease protein 1-like 3 [Takifugu flavidus]
MLLQKADEELRRMETTVGEPTDTNRKELIRYLLEGTQRLTAEFALGNSDVISHIINCSTAILLLSETKCDIDTNPNPTSLFEDVFQIFHTITLLLGSNSVESFIIKHSMGTMYQSSHMPADLDNVVLGSQQDGEYIKLPSFSALKSQIRGQNRITTQMSTFSTNPHPSNDSISGTVCSLVLSEGDLELKLTNLTEMIEIFMPRANASPITYNTVVLEKDTKALTRFNVSDPNMTIIFHVEPSANVSLVLTLAQGLPNQNRSSSTVTLNQTGSVGEKSTPVRAQCLCNHLTLYGSSFFVMPNDVDISRTADLFATVSQNYVVLALLCAFFGLYLITLLWACYSDRRSRSKRKMTLLEDNHAGALYNYLISVQTGHRKNAGTTANVTLKLSGSEGESNIHTLADPDKRVFERGAVDLFLLATPFPLGEVRNIRLQHDNTGGSPSWYVNKVTIQDLQTRQVWHFLCDCWLSDDRGDGITKKMFNAAKNNEIASFRWTGKIFKNPFY